MFAVILSSLVAIAIAGGVYLGWEKLGSPGVGMAALRAGALIALAILFFNPVRTEHVRGGPPTVLLDASLSMGARGAHWQAAVDTAQKLAGSGGAILRFGSEVTPFDTTAPAGGGSQLGDALRAAAARTGPIIVVSDGAVDDAEVLPLALLRGMKLVLVPRDTIPDVALMDVAMEPRAQRSDSIGGTLLISTVGPVTETTGRFEVFDGTRRLIAQELPLPKSPGIARRTFVLPPRSLDAGTHVLRFELHSAGDAEPDDDVRERVLTVTEQPSVVVLVNPSDWESRFLASTLGEVAHTTVRGFARVRTDRWVDMRSLAVVSENDLRSAVRGAALVVTRGDVGPELAGWRGPVWRWPAGTDQATTAMPGDWYVQSEIPASPIAGRFAAVEWDSVPPLDQLVPMVLAPGDWTGLLAKLGRRGSNRPVLVGRDTAGVRTLTVAAEGLYHWGLRGGAPREAYRAVIAGGVDWLLGADAIRRSASIMSSDVVARGMPVAFRWSKVPVPDSTVIRLTRGDSSITSILHFDAEGVSRVNLPPGTWRWSVPGTSEPGGIAVVEKYSDEFRVRPVSMQAGGDGESLSTVERRPRDWWLIFVIAVIAFCGEWAWRLRRGLP
jgi:hypothetical protein